MTYIEKGALLQALRALGVYALYLKRMQGHHTDGTLYAPKAGVLVGRAALWLIGLKVGAGIALNLLVLGFVLADLTVNLLKFRAYLKGF